MRRVDIPRLFGLAAVILGGGCVAAWANDSSAELSVGGLTFKQTPDVSMESEELTISADNIIVRYRFLNQSAAPVTLTVGFPLPDIDLADADNIAFPTSDPVNFVGFQTRVDGKPINFNIVQRAMLGEKNVSQAIRDAGLQLLPLGNYQEQIAALPANVRDKLINDGLLMPAGSDERGQTIYGGTWVVKTSVVRQQTFPPGKPVAVEHRYKASVGVTFDTVLRKAIRESSGMAKEFERYRTEYCVPDELLRAIDKIAGNAEANTAKFREQRISYILKTGANWAGPIKDFRLVVDKGKPDRLVSFCADNVKKISPTQFEMRATDFTPQRDLKVLIIDRRS